MVKIDSSLLRSFIIISLICIVVAALWAGKEVLVPIFLAGFLSLILHLPLAAAEARGVPRIAGIFIITMVMVGLGVLLQIYAVQPAQELIEDYPRIKAELETKIDKLRYQYRSSTLTGDGLEEAAEDVSKLIDTKSAPEVSIEQTSFLSKAATSLARGTGSLIVVLVICFFILAIREPFLTLATASFSGFPAKRRAARIWIKVERRVSEYFLAVTLINVGLGAVVGTALAFAGMPYPSLWGVVVALLNYMPFVEPAIGAAALLVVSVVTFDSLPYALVPPAIYLALNFIEANFVTPSVVGNKMNISPLAVIIALLFWGWLWDFSGFLISVPILVVVKAIVDETPDLAVVSRLIAQRR